MFHLFDLVGKTVENHEEPTMQAPPSDEKLDEIQMLEQAQSRLPTFCPHSSPFASSCRSILSDFEWYAEEPLLGIDGTEPLLERPPTVDFPATSTADHRTDLDQVPAPSDNSTTTGEYLMQRLSAQHVENCHPMNQLIVAADDDSPPFVVDTSTVSCPSRAVSPTTASPLTDLPIDDDQALVAAPRFPSDDDMAIEADAGRPSIEIRAGHVAISPEQAGASFDSLCKGTMAPTAEDDNKADAVCNDASDSDTGSDRDDDDSDNEDAEEEPQLSPRLVDARALYEAYLQRRAETGENEEWPTSSEGEASGYGDDDEDDEDGHEGDLFIAFAGAWQDHRALHRRNEDFPYHTYKPPLVGDGFQADLPPLLTEEQRAALAGAPVTKELGQSDSDVDDDGPRQEELMWSPDSTTDDLVEDYLAHVQGLLDHDHFSEEKALVALHRHSYDVNDALAALLVDPKPFHKERWSDEEKLALVTGWSLYGKSWKKIQTMVSARSTGEIMQFYYQHKPRADYIRRQSQGVDDESESDESEEEPIDERPDEASGPIEDTDRRSPLLRETTSSSPSSSPSSPASGSWSPRRPLPTSPHQSDLAPVHMPMGEDESDHEVERQRSPKRRWTAEVDGDSQDSDEVQQQQQLKKRKRDEAATHGKRRYREDNVDGAEGEGNDKSEEDEERSAASGKRARVDRDDDGDDREKGLGVWSREEEKEESTRGIGQLDTPASS